MIYLKNQNIVCFCLSKVLLNKKLSFFVYLIDKSYRELDAESIYKFNILYILAYFSKYILSKNKDAINLLVIYHHIQEEKSNSTSKDVISINDDLKIICLNEVKLNLKLNFFNIHEI